MRAVLWKTKFDGHLSKGRLVNMRFAVMRCP
jgi:signal recognition particle subunit SEC65